MAEAGTSDGLLAVRLVTPERVLVDTTVSAVELPSRSGYLEALYGAAPLLAELGAGEVKLHGGPAGDQTIFVAWGMVEVLPERVTILAEQALKPNEIDLNVVTGEEQHARELWNQAGDNQVRYDEANAAARVAEAKREAAQGSERKG